MQRYIYSALLIGMFAIETLSTNGQNIPGGEHNPVEVIGGATNGLQPHLLCEKSGMSWNDWSIEIDYVAQTNFSRFSWLKITNSMG